MVNFLLEEVRRRRNDPVRKQIKGLKLLKSLFGIFPEVFKIKIFKFHNNRLIKSSKRQKAENMKEKTRGKNTQLINTNISLMYIAKKLFSDQGMPFCTHELIAPVVKCKRPI